MKPNLDKLENLSDDQLKKISSDVDTVGIRKAAAQASKDTDRSIDKTSIQRLKERSIVNRFLAESPDAAQAATEILRFAVTGRPGFSEATIKVLEETAFKLSLQCSEPEEETDRDSEVGKPEMPPKDSGKPNLSISEFALKALNQITVMLARYRNTSVRERMAKLQEKKFELRCLEFEWKKSVHAAKAVSDKSQIKNQKSQIPENDLDRLAKTLDDVERRTCETFNLPYDGPTKQQSSPSPSPQTSSDAKVAVEAGKTLLAEATTPIAETKPATSDPGRPYLQSEKNSEPPSALNSTVAASSPVAVSLQGAQQSEIPTPQSARIEPYLQTEKNLQSEASPLPSVESSSQLNHPSPAPSSTSSSVNSVPSVVNENIVPPRVKSHAIRRWRAHIPWPKGEPEPDGSWRNECPCGNPAPCSEHPELKGRVRGYKPQHPEYQFSLKQFNVPYYKPTAEEIGCTQAALDRSCDLFADNPRMKDPPDPRFAPKWLKRSES